MKSNKKKRSGLLPGFAVLCIAAIFSFTLAGCDNGTGGGGDGPALPVTYTVTFDLDGGNIGGNTANPAAQTVAAGGTVTNPGNAAKSGRAFSGWFNGDVRWNFDSGTVSGNVTLKARYDTVTYTVTFNSNGGSDVASQTVVQGGTPTEPTAPSRTDGVFQGWYTDNTTFQNAYNFSTAVTAALTLYAKWQTVFALGETGPGGGKIFYVSTGGFTYYTSGTDSVGTTAHYLEAAPTDSGTKKWSSSSTYNTYDISGTETGIGTGRRNTLKINAVDNGDNAANACKNLTAGGKTDWFLPSKDELGALCTNRDHVGNFGSGYYWSSSQYHTYGNYYAWNMYSEDGWQNNNTKDNQGRVRAVRAF